MNPVYNSVPIASVVSLSVEERITYIEKALGLPSSLKEIVISERTSAFLRGVLKTYDVSEKQGPSLALLILRVTIGQQPLNQLSTAITNTLQISQDKASKIAQEIERELFGPVVLELNSHLNQTQKFGQARLATPPITKPTMAAQGVRNVVDLKQQTARPPMAPPMSANPVRPIATPLPSRPITPSRPPKPPTIQPLKPLSSKPALPFDKDSLQKKSKLWEAK